MLLVFDTHDRAQLPAEGLGPLSRFTWRRLGGLY